MEGLVINFRRGRHTQTNNQMIIEVEGMDKEKANSLLGKEILWKSPAGKELKGKISALHGGKGRVRAVLERGMPGQAIGTKIEIR